MNSRRSMIDAIAARLGRREVIWGGLRSDDIEAISDLPNLAASFSIVGGHNRGGAVVGFDFEDLAGERVDTDAWDIEDHLASDAAHAFREALLTRLAGPSALLPYRPSMFLSSVAFARSDSCLPLGLFGGHQAMFEYKPWVETQVDRMGIPRVPWMYIADEEKTRARRMLRDGPIILRVSRSSGGAGMVLVEDQASLVARWPHRREAFVSVSPYLQDAIPMNLGATVWRDGVTVGHPSLQVIGVPECTSRRFGYCGNDFGGARDMPDDLYDEVETSVRMLGRWLRDHGYRGTFGIDFLVHEGVPLFGEINARFQGSTHASSQLSGEAGESCLILDHIGAMLGFDAPKRPPLREVVRSLPRFSHVVVHWNGDVASVDASSLVSRLRTDPSTDRVDVVAKPHLVVQPGAMVARATLRRPVTTTGFDLDTGLRSTLSKWAEATHHCGSLGPRG